MIAWLRGQSGFSLVPAMATLALLILLGGVAVQEALSALRNAGREEGVKRALQAADAGIDAAIFRLNRADLTETVNIDPRHPETVINQTCVVGTGTVAGYDLSSLPVGAVPDPDGKRWCAETEPEQAGDGASWTYRVSELARVGAGSCTGDGLLSLDREIVAVGRSGSNVRRVRARLRAAIALLSGASVQSASGTSRLDMSGTARVLGDAASNYDIRGALTNVIAGSAVPGPGRTVSGGVIPAGGSSAACSKFVLPEVNPGDSKTVNDNAAITTGCVSLLVLATPCSTTILGITTTSGGVDPVAATKPVLRVWGTGRATLNGGTYSFCSIRLEGQGILQIRSTTPVTRIFLRDPADCSGVAGAGQTTVDGSAKIVNCHAQTQPQTLQLYALGSGTVQTFVGGGLLSATATLNACGVNIALAGVPMVVYAPHSQVAIGGTTAIAGQVAGDTVVMSGAAAVQPVNALVNLNQLGSNPTLPLYKAVDYVECIGKSFAQLPASHPSQGC